MYSRLDCKYQLYWYLVGDGGYREEEVKMIGILNFNDWRMEIENDLEQWQVWSWMGEGIRV